MAAQNNGRKPVTLEELANRKLKIAQNKAKVEEKRQLKIQEKAAFFKKTPGKILKGLSVAVTLFCIVFLVDGQLKRSYTEFEIKSSAEDIVPLYMQGWVVNSSFNWAYLDDNQEFGIHMHHDEFNKIIESGLIELGRSPIFKTPTNFRVKNEIGLYNYSEFEVEYNYLYSFPFILILLSVLWLLSKPNKSLQWIMFGYLHMVVTPVLFFFLLLRVIEYLTGSGMYEINVAGLNI